MRRSKIYTVSDEDFIFLVKNSKSMSELLSKLILENKGGNYLTVKRRIKQLNISTEHFLSRTNASLAVNKMTLEKFLELIKGNSKIKRHSLKIYLLRFNLKEYKCFICENDGYWNNQKLSLQLDHINGNSNDHRLDNIRFLCPNCHSQTDNFAGKKRKISREPYKCKNCNKIKLNKSPLCMDCFIMGKHNILNISVDNLLEKIKLNSMREVSRLLNIPYTSLTRFCIKNNIDYKNLCPSFHD